MNFIDLFCGAGGFSIGFKTAGFTLVHGVDNWGIAVDSYRANVGDCIDTDISNYNADKNVDIIIGSPPCKTFSTSNTANRECDLSLTKQFMRIVRDVNPKVWIMENVSNTYELVDTPYKYTFDMSDYGMLQKRRRSFFSNIPLNLKKTENKYIGVEHEEKIMGFRPEVIHRKYQTVTCRYHSYSKTNPCIMDDEKLRFLNHEEALAIQTFPFDYQLPETGQRNIETLIGNAVPPKFSYKLALAVEQSLLEGRQTNIDNWWAK